MKNAYEFLDKAFSDFIDFHRGDSELNATSASIIKTIKDFYCDKNVRHSYASINHWMNSKWGTYSDDFEFFILVLSLVVNEIEEEWLKGKVEKLIDHLELDYANFSYYKTLEDISRSTVSEFENQKTKLDILHRSVDNTQAILDGTLDRLEQKSEDIENLNKDIEIAKDGAKNLSDQLRSQRFDTIGLMTLVFTLFTLVGSNATVIGKVSTADFCHFFKILLAVNVTIALSGVIIFLFSKWCITGKFRNKNW